MTQGNDGTNEQPRKTPPPRKTSVSRAPAASLHSVSGHFERDAAEVAARPTQKKTAINAARAGAAARPAASLTARNVSRPAADTAGAKPSSLPPAMAEKCLPEPDDTTPPPRPRPPMSSLPRLTPDSFTGMAPAVASAARAAARAVAAQQAAGTSAAGAQHNAKPALSVVIPCHNAAATLDELHRRVGNACREAVNDDYEVVLVNDGSSDDSWQQMQTLAAQDDRIVAINLTRNYGQQLALSAGLKFARGTRVLTLDGDLQDPPELLADMMVKAETGFDVVYGQRQERDGETWLVRTGNGALRRLVTLMVKQDAPVGASDFRLISRRALDLLNAMPEQHRYLRGMIDWLGLPQAPIAYHRDDRYADRAGLPLRRALCAAVDAMTGFSTRPLRLAAYLGIAFGLFGLSMAAYALATWLAGASVAGWTSLMTAILLLGSVQLIMLGVVGEYVGRLYLESKGRPLFVIEEIVRGNQGALHHSHLGAIPSAE